MMWSTLASMCTLGQAASVLSAICAVLPRRLLPSMLLMISAMGCAASPWPSAAGCEGEEVR